jgi:hypothetical protein
MQTVDKWLKTKREQSKLPVTIARKTFVSLAKLSGIMASRVKKLNMRNTKTGLQHQGLTNALNAEHLLRKHKDVCI